MSAQGRIVAIMFVIGVTMIAAVIYVRDLLVFDRGVEAVTACGRSIELGDSTDRLRSKLGSEACAGLVQVDLPQTNGSLRMHARFTPFHDNWHLVIETKANAVSAIRHRSGKQKDVPPKGAPPDRVSDR